MGLTIGHIVGRWLPRSETFTGELIRSMKEFSHEVFTTRTENLDLFPFEHLRVCHSESEYPALARWLGVDLLLCHFGPLGLSGLPVGLALDIPVVTVFHGYDVSMLLRDERWVERYRTLFRFGSHALCISEAGRQRLLAIGCPPERVCAIHLGVDVNRFTPGLRRHPRPSPPHRLLMVARLAEKKGIDVALQAMRLVLDAGHDVALRVAGEGEEHDALEQLKTALGLDAHVALVGPLDSAGVRREMADADMLLQPSVTAASGDQEGIPVALMEALAMGLPVVATKHAGIPELVLDGETGLLVPERDPAALAAAIGELVTRPDLAGRLARGGRRWVLEEFNLRTQAGRTEQFLRDVIEVHRTTHVRHAAPPRGDEKRPRLLYLRSVPVPQALSQLALLADRHPETSITVVTDEATRDVFGHCDLVSQVHTHAGGRMSVMSLPPSTLAALRAPVFDRVVVPYANGDGDGYDNVSELAFLLKSRAVVAMPATHREVPLEPVAHHAHA